jgi:hypothetical protein
VVVSLILNPVMSGLRPLGNEEKCSFNRYCSDEGLSTIHEIDNAGEGGHQCIFSIFGHVKVLAV